ncbi:DB module family protein [Acanthocheilonema viteae]
MNKLFGIFVLTSLIILAQGYGIGSLKQDFHGNRKVMNFFGTQNFYQYHLGDEELMKPSEADFKFMDCCSKEIGENTCTNHLCSFSGISKMTYFEFLSTIKKCQSKTTKIWKCGTKMSNQISCCMKSGVPKECLGYCSGIPRAKLSCLFHSSQIIHCFRKNLLSNL